MYVKNASELINSSESLKALRRTLLFFIDQALDFINPRNVIKNAVSLKQNSLKIKGTEFDLTNYQRIFVFGIGKASGYMAEAIEKILGNKITGGKIIIVEGTRHYYLLKKISILEGTHPVPSQLNIESTNLFIEDIKNLTANDLAIFLISGGGSALLCKPEEGISLEDLQLMNKSLLKSGLNIKKINSIRKHVSLVKGGNLLKHVNNATSISLIISDVLGDPIDMIASGPTYPDRSTFSDCLDILDQLKNYDIPESVITHIKKGKNKLIQETPKKTEAIFKKTYHQILVNLEMACNHIQESASKLKIESDIYSITLEGEAKEVGKELLDGAMKLRKEFGKKILLIAGGETTVTVKGEGLGGRNSELILGALSHVNFDNNFVMASIGTDGSDNSKDFEIAGALIDSTSHDLSIKKNLSIENYLSRNDSHNFFKKLGNSLIKTGNTGTNIADIMLVLME